MILDHEIRSLVRRIELFEKRTLSTESLCKLESALAACPSMQRPASDWITDDDGELQGWLMWRSVDCLLDSEVSLIKRRWCFAVAPPMRDHRYARDPILLPLVTTAGGLGIDPNLYGRATRRIPGLLRKMHREVATQLKHLQSAHELLTDLFTERR